jgi:hypothetical protein
MWRQGGGGEEGGASKERGGGSKDTREQGGVEGGAEGDAERAATSQVNSGLWGAEGEGHGTERLCVDKSGGGGCAQPREGSRGVQGSCTGMNVAVVLSMANEPCVGSSNGGYSV